MRVLIVSAVLLSASLLTAAIDRSGSPPGWDHVADLGKILAIGASGLRWSLGERNALDCGADNTGATYADDALNACIVAMGVTGNPAGYSSNIEGLSAGRTLYVPKGVYKLRTPIDLVRRVRLTGDGPHSTIFLPDAGVSGIIVHYPCENGHSPNCDLGRGDFSSIDHVSVQYLAAPVAWQATHAYSLGTVVYGPTNTNVTVVFQVTTAGTSAGSEPSWSSTAEGSFVTDGGVTWQAIVAAGIRLKAGARISNVYINHAPGNALHIQCGVPDSNCNGWLVDYALLQSSGLNGVYVQGNDSNAGLGTSINADSNRLWGIYDNSFLGNNYVGCEVASNLAGAYAMLGASAPNQLIGCYSESDHLSRVLAPSQVIGGAGLIFTSDSTGSRIFNGVQTNGGQFTFRDLNAPSGSFVQMPFSNDYVINISDTANGGIGGAGFTLQSGSSGNAGWWTWRHGNGDARRFMQWSGATAAEGPGQIRFPNGFSFGDAFTNSSRLVVGPTSSVNTDLCAFSGTGGTTLTDSGIPSANVVLVSRNIIAGTGLTGGGALTSDVTLSASLSGPTSSTSGDLVAFSGTGGTRLSDSGIPGTAIVVRGSSPFTTSFGIGISAPTGINNTMIGYHAANLLTAGAENTMLGYLAGSVQTTSDRNTLLGSNAGELTTTGAENTCVGWRACDGATTMTNGTFIGSRAGLNLTMTGDSNVAVGHGAMASGDGNNNTAIGTSALFSITGGGNTAVGLAAGAAISVGTLNTAVGQQALGVGGPLSGSLNLALGYGAGASLTTSDHDNICISNAGVSGDAGVIRIGTIGTHTTVAIVANAVGANPATGITGHNVRSCVTAPSGLTLSNNTPTNIASLTLGAGNWEISAVGGLDGSLTGTDFLVGISGTSGSFSGTSKGLTQVESPTVSSATADITLTIPGVQFLPTTSTTYYLVEQTTIAAGTALGYGCISAWSR